MRLLLIRHGETVDNVAGKYAGITDSALTNHGVLQTNRLGTYLAATDVKISHIFSSDLQRAVKTAEAIQVAQSPAPREFTKLELLREQDFGFYEGKHFFERPHDLNKTEKDAHLEAHQNDPSFKDVESKESMTTRIETFIDTHLLALLDEVQEGHSVAIVAHGIILIYLWKGILKRFHAADVQVLTGVITTGRAFSLEHLGGWSNTGYLDLDLRSKLVPVPVTILPVEKTASASGFSGDSKKLPTPETQPDITAAVSPKGFVIAQPSKLLPMSLMVRAVNSLEHLKGLKKTRGGIGSSKHDSRQKTLDTFIKKRRLE